MNNKKALNIKSILLTVFSVFALFLIIYSFIGVFISGPYYKSMSDENKIINKIESDNKKITSISRNSFKYVTYTCISNKYIYIYDQEGNLLLHRKNDSLRYDDVKTILENKYPNLVDAEIKVGYGYKNIAYLIEKDNELLVLDYDTLKKKFYMKEGE